MMHKQSGCACIEGHCSNRCHMSGMYTPMQAARSQAVRLQREQRGQEVEAADNSAERTEATDEESANPEDQEAFEQSRWALRAACAFDIRVACVQLNQHVERR